MSYQCSSQYVSSGLHHWTPRLQYGYSASGQRCNRRPTYTPIAWLMTGQPHKLIKYGVARHTVLNQWASLLPAYYPQPMSSIPQTLHAQVSTFCRPGSAASGPHRSAHDSADLSYLHLALSSAPHVILHNCNLTMCCPARQGLIGKVRNYAHCWRFFTSYFMAT